VSGPDRDHFPAADELAATPFERDLAALEPAAPSGGLRERIAAELAAVPATPPRGAGFQAARPEPTSAPGPATHGPAIRGVFERLAWAVGGALAATVVLGLPARDAGRREAPERIIAVDPAPVVAAARPPAPPGPGLPATPLLSEETSRWADEGVTFLDDITPARVLRRMVVERHQAADGRAEVRVPRADVILLPVAFQ